MGTVRESLRQRDASYVINIPIPLEDQDDKLIWPFRQDGRMSVQTAYHVVRHTSITSGNTLQPTTQPLALWKSIWAGQVWPKVRTFMWKLASNSLPVRSNLDRRGIPISPTCSACDEEETAEHMVRGCSWTIGVWEGVLGISTTSDSQELMVS